MAKVRTIITVFSFVLLLPICSFSQTPAAKPTLRMPMRPWMGENNRCWKAADLNLSPDQTKGLALINQTYATEIRPLRIELFSKRMELREFLMNPATKPESIQHKTTEIIALESKIDEREIDYLMKVRSLLTQEQIKSWCPEEDFHFLRGMMQRPEFTGPINPRRTPTQERPKEE